MKYRVGSVRQFTSPTGTISWEYWEPCIQGEKFIVGEPLTDRYGQQIAYAAGPIWICFRAGGQRFEACLDFLRKHTRAVR